MSVIDRFEKPAWVNTPAEDVKLPLTFEVEGLRHVIGSCAGDPNNCAGARALKDTLEIEDACVYKTCTHILYTDGRHVRMKNPSSLYRGTKEYDGMGVFIPGVHTLLPMPESLSTAYRGPRNADRYARNKAAGKPNRTGKKPGSKNAVRGLWRAA